jgi:hypothetical protein
MTPDQFQEALAQIKRDSESRHLATQQRIDSVVTGVRDGLRDDIGLMLKPVTDKIESHGKKLDDHETRIRGLETESTRRSVYIGGGVSLAMVAVVEGVRAMLKIKGSG